MLELKAKTIKHPISINSEICSSFKYPIIFYLMHNDDSRAFFPVFVILDFSKKQLSFTATYFPENIQKVENDKNSLILKAWSSALNPHSSVQIKEGESFLTFVERVRYFYLVDYKRDIVKVYTEEDLGFLSDEKVLEFGSTFYKDSENGDFFYFTVLFKKVDSKERILRFYKARTDMSEMQEIYSKSTSLFFAPHVTRKIGNFILNSEFIMKEMKHAMTGKVFPGLKEFMDYVYCGLYKEYCELNNIEYSEERFFKNNLIWPGKIKLESDFGMFCQFKGYNFFELCKRNKEYSFLAEPGKIMMVDLEKQEMQYSKTTFCSPAHFEIDDKTGAIYVSSHNFVLFDRIYYLGPAAIDKFLLKNGKLEKIGTFSDPTGFRFTTHKLFHYKGHPYFCTFGQPNRLFFVDAETMRVEYFEDIGGDYISQYEDILAFINSGNLEPITVKTIEVSDDGQFLFLLSYDCIYFYSFPERKIIQRVDYHFKEVNFGENLSMDNFYKRTTHVDYLK